MKVSHKTIHRNIMELMNGMRLFGSILNKNIYLDFINYNNILYFRYSKWLPDNVVGRHDTKTTYQVEIRYANNTNETHTFHGPPGNFRSIFSNILWT